ncbi:IS3 family transposase, partial [Escherichia coli]
MRSEFPDYRELFRESDIKSGVLRKAVRLRYAFIRDNTCCWPVRLLCRVLDVHPSGFYAWLQQPHSQRHQADLRLTGQIKQFNPDAPDKRWVTDITYIRTHEGWLYLAVVVDLFSRKIIGWSM